MVLLTLCSDYHEVLKNFDPALFLLMKRITQLSIFMIVLKIKLLSNIQALWPIAEQNLEISM